MGWLAYQALDRAGAESEARAALNQASKVQEPVPEVEAETLLEISSREERLAKLRELAQRAPHSPQVKLALAAACLQAGLTDEMVTHLEDMVKVASGNNVVRGYAGLMAKMNRTAQALSLVERLVEERPGDHGLLRLAGELSSATDPVPQALTYYRKAIDRGGAPGLLNLYQAQLLLKEKKATEAITHLELAINEAPQSGLLYELLGDALRESGQKAEASQAFKTSLAFRPSSRVRGKLSDLNGEQPVSKLVTPLELAPYLEIAAKTPSGIQRSSHPRRGFVHPLPRLLI